MQGKALMRYGGPNTSYLGFRQSTYPKSDWCVPDSSGQGEHVPRVYRR